jgi:uncharacterized membrane protein YadS
VHTNIRAYIIKILSLLHADVSATIVAILTKDILQKTLRTKAQMQNGLKYVLKYKIELNVVLK